MPFTFGVTVYVPRCEPQYTDEKPRGPLATVTECGFVPPKRQVIGWPTFAVILPGRKKSSPTVELVRRRTR